MSKLLDENSTSEDVKLYVNELRGNLAIRISLMFLVVFSILTYAYSFDSFESLLVMSFGVFVSLFCLIVMLVYKNYNLVFYVYSTLGVVVTSYALLFFHETVHLVDVLWMLAAVSLAFFGIGKRVGIVLLVFSLIVIAIFVFYSLNINIETVKPRNTFQKMSLVVEMISGFTLNFYLFHLFTTVSIYSTNKLREVNLQLTDQNAKIRLQNNEKTMLVREVHHRVKNNLQIIVSLLRLQSMEIESEKLKVDFEESIQRIMAMSLIHQKLYQNESLSQVKFIEYVNELINTIIKTDAEGREIDFIATSEIEKVGLKSLIPIALILNELTLNSLKHAFHEKIDCVIQLEVYKGESDKWIKLIYKDNGNWDESKNEHQSFGLMLVDTLVEQLDGTKEIIKEKSGTTFKFHLSNVVEPDIVA